MKKKAKLCKNRGRVQAQDRKLQESVSWDENNIPSKKDGETFLTQLERKLDKTELELRTRCFEKAKRFVTTAPKNGHGPGLVSVSFPVLPPLDQKRVDIEIIQGFAFKD